MYTGETFFEVGPFRERPFDDSETLMVKRGQGFTLGQKMRYVSGAQEVAGFLASIGVNSKYGDGTKFTVCMIQTNKTVCLQKINDLSEV